MLCAGWGQSKSRKGADIAGTKVLIVIGLHFEGHRGYERALIRERTGAGRKAEMALPWSVLIVIEMAPSDATVGSIPVHKNVTSQTN